MLLPSSLSVTTVRRSRFRATLISGHVLAYLECSRQQEHGTVRLLNPTRPCCIRKFSLRFRDRGVRCSLAGVLDRGRD